MSKTYETRHLFDDDISFDLMILIEVCLYHCIHKHTLRFQKSEEQAMMKVKSQEIIDKSLCSCSLDETSANMIVQLKLL